MDFQPIAHIACKTAAKTAAITLTEMYCGTGRLEGRKQIILFNRSQHKLFWSLESDTNVRHCNAIKAGAYLSLNVGDNIPVYARGVTVPLRVIVNELA